MQYYAVTAQVEVVVMAKSDTEAREKVTNILEEVALDVTILEVNN